MWIGLFEPLGFVLFAWGTLGSSCIFPYFSQNQSFSSQVEDFRRKIVEVGKVLLITWKIGWMVRRIVMVIWKVRLVIGRIIGMLEVIWMVWPWVIIVVLALWEIQVISPVRIVRWCVRIIIGPWTGNIHRFRKLLLSLEHWTLLKHIIHDLTVSTARSWKLVWADLVDWTWFLSF